MGKEFNLKTGKVGEEIAREYLKKKGYKILEQNCRSRFGEIDLVAKDAKDLVIIEVRTKRGEQFGTPEESLDKKKLKKLWLNARGYAGRVGWAGPYRVDGVCVVLGPGSTLKRLAHYQSIV